MFLNPALSSFCSFLAYLSSTCLNANHFFHYEDCRDKGTWEWEYDGEPYIIDGTDEVRLVMLLVFRCVFMHAPISEGQNFC